LFNLRYPAFPIAARAGAVCAIARERWSSRSVRQQAEPPLRKKAASGVVTTA
jgi:hypothetical protein